MFYRPTVHEPCHVVVEFVHRALVLDWGEEGPDRYQAPFERFRVLEPDAEAGPCFPFARSLFFFFPPIMISLISLSAIPEIPHLLKHIIQCWRARVVGVRVSPRLL